jgi:hypothetical protein
MLNCHSPQELAEEIVQAESASEPFLQDQRPTAGDRKGFLR